MASRMNADGLRALRSRLAGIGGPDFRANLARLCGVAALKLVADEFRGSHAPDGTPWAALKSRFAKLGRRQYGPRRLGKPLLNTGRLRASFGTVPTADGFRVWTAVSYAGYHQTGTRRMVARPMVPAGGALPAPWRDAMVREINAAVRRQLLGAA